MKVADRWKLPVLVWIWNRVRWQCAVIWFVWKEIFWRITPPDIYLRKKQMYWFNICKKNWAMTAYAFIQEFSTAIYWLSREVIKNWIVHLRMMYLWNLSVHWWWNHWFRKRKKRQIWLTTWFWNHRNCWKIIHWIWNVWQKVKILRTVFGPGVPVTVRRCLLSPRLSHR